MAEDLEQRLRALEIHQAQTDVLIPRLEQSIDRLTTAVEELTAYTTKAKGGIALLLGAAGLLTAVVEGMRALIGHWGH